MQGGGIYRTATILLPNIIFQLMSETEEVRKCYPGRIYRTATILLPNIIFQLMSETTDLQDSHNFASKHNLSADV